MADPVETYIVSDPEDRFNGDVSAIRTFLFVFCVRIVRVPAVAVGLTLPLLSLPRFRKPVRMR